jgi:hypothetical protein
LSFWLDIKIISNKYNGLTEQQIKNSIEEFNVVMEKGYLTEMYPDIKNLNKEPYSGKSDQDFLKDIENQYKNHQAGIYDQLKNRECGCNCGEGNSCIDGETTQQFLGSIGMEGQMLRQLIMSQPIDEIKYLIEEREDLEKVRILSEISKEKDMKVHYDFNEGILRIKKYLENYTEQSKTNLFKDIKQCDDIDDLRRAISHYELAERVIEQAIENLEQAGSMAEIFMAVEDTWLGGDEDRIISLLLNIEIEVI